VKEKRMIHYKKGVFVCPKCRQTFVQEKWIEEWRIRCHKCDYRGTLTEISVEEHMDEETQRRCFFSTRIPNTLGLCFSGWRQVRE